MTASQQPTGHDKAVEIVAEAITGGKERAALLAVRNPGEMVNADRDARAALAALRAALAAGDADVAEALGLKRRVAAANFPDRAGEAVWFQTTPVWTWTEAP